MANDNKNRKLSRKNLEYIKFLFFLLVVIILIKPLMDIITRSWTTDSIRHISEAIRNIYPSGISVIINAVFGFYIGSLVLMFQDKKKRIQTLFLTIGIVAAAIYLFIFYNVGWNILYISIFIVAGYVLGGGLKPNRGEYKQATRNITGLSIGYIFISYLIIYFSPGQINQSFIRDTFIILAYSIFFRETINYTIKGPRIFILGPAESGKTLFLLGCYLRVIDSAEGHPHKPNPALLHLVNQLNKSDIHPWPIPQTKKITEYQFVYEIRELFPKETTVRSIDFPGPWLVQIPKYINYKNLDSKEAEETKGYIALAREVLNSDKLIFIIDGSLYPNFGDMGIESYIDIITKLSEKGRDIDFYIVITKSDYFMEEFRNPGDYDGFRKFLFEEKFSKSRNFKQLLNETFNAPFYPVFYYTKKDESGKLIPIKDEHGDVITFGFKEFLDDML